jgi:hypothetical protein
VDDEAKLADAANSLASAFERSLGPWVKGAVAHRHQEPLSPATVADTEAAAAEASDRIACEIRKLLETDIDTQWTSPLAIARQVVPLATEVLQRAGVSPIPRDPNASRLHPEDLYDLTPGTFADFGAQVHEPGITWGAAKAYVHMSRRKAEGRR